MAQTLKDIRGGGGSIKVGTTGTISALMTRELESTKSALKAPSSCMPDSVPSGEETSRTLKPGTSADEGGSSSSSSANGSRNRKCSEVQKLKSDDTSIDTTPSRKKPAKKRHGVVEIVDLKCGNPDKTWADAITNRLKKFGFSKLSDSVA